AAAAVVINNQKAQEASAGAQEESALDVANAENSENTPELDTQPTEAETPETAEEVKAEEVTTPEETEEPETAEADTEPTAEPEYTYTDMSATMYASQTVNVRDLPSTDGNRVGGLSTNQEIAVTGQCNETGWYRFEYNGSTAYVSNNYVSENKVEVAAAEPAASTDTAPEQAAASDTSNSSSSGTDELAQYATYTWIDMGDWFLYIAPDGQNHNYYETGTLEILESRYPNKWCNGFWVILDNGTRLDFRTVCEPYPQAFIDLVRKYYNPNYVPYH
ncbi:MAG: SH3 domain-containing protein, partial [Lachnospiraceae bacterium]|nr:SH3 domain-containing protein [Lachnospiraceae bacterium]